MIKTEDIVKKHGFNTLQEARRAAADADLWLRKHRGKRPPVHVQKAVSVVKELEARQNTERQRVSKKLRRLSRNPRVWLGVVDPASRTAKLRLWARRTFKLYLNPEQMARHFAALLPTDFAGHWNGADGCAREAALDGLAETVVRLYGLGRNNPWSFVDDLQRFAPWDRAKGVAYIAVRRTAGYGV